jgi:hypothetical protein
MKQLRRLLVVALVVVVSSAIAQQSPSPQTVPETAGGKVSAGSPSSSTPPPQPPAPGLTAHSAITPGGAISINLPNPVKIEATSTGSGGVSGWLVLFGVFVTAGASLWVGNWTARAAAESRALTSQIAEKERQVKLDLAQLELTTKREHFKTEQEEKKRQTDLANSQEGRKFLLGLQQLGFQSGVSDNDAYQAAMRFLHEQQVAEAELIRSFSDRLLSENERERSFALLTLSAYISPKMIKRLAAGGDDVISTASLKKLAAIDDPEIAGVVQSILQRRQLS